MVGQMISLNQLDQLISINQAVNPTSSTLGGLGGATAGVTKVSNADSATNLAAKQALLASVNGASTAGASPNTVANALSTNAVLNAAAAAGSVNASSTGALNLSNFNSFFGGK